MYARGCSLRSLERIARRKYSTGQSFPIYRAAIPPPPPTNQQLKPEPCNGCKHRKAQAAPPFFPNDTQTLALRITQYTLTRVEFLTFLVMMNWNSVA